MSVKRLFAEIDELRQLSRAGDEIGGKRLVRVLTGRKVHVAEQIDEARIRAERIDPQVSF